MSQYIQHVPTILSELDNDRGVDSETDSGIGGSAIDEVFALGLFALVG